MDSRDILEPPVVTDYSEALADLQVYRYGCALAEETPLHARGPPSSPDGPISEFARTVQRQAWDLPSRLRPRRCRLGQALLHSGAQLRLTGRLAWDLYRPPTVSVTYMSNHLPVNFLVVLRGA